MDDKGGLWLSSVRDYIIGANHVGTCCKRPTYQGLVTELYISDTNEVLWGKAQVNDLLDAMPFYPHPARVYELDDRYEGACWLRHIAVNAAGHIEAAAGVVMVSSSLPLTRPRSSPSALQTLASMRRSTSNPCDVVTTELQVFDWRRSTRSSAWYHAGLRRLRHAFPALPAIQHLASTLDARRARQRHVCLLVARFHWPPLSPSTKLQLRQVKTLTSRA